MKAKKVLAMLMASAMIMGTSVTAFAGQTATITVNNLDANATYHYLQVVEPDTTSTIGWKFVDGYADEFMNAFGVDTAEEALEALIALGGDNNAASGTIHTNTQLNTALTALVGSVREEGTAVTEVKGGTGVTSALNEAGLYVIVADTSNANYTYVPMMAYIEDTGSGDLQNATVTAKGSYNPIDKGLAEESTATDQSVSEGDIVTFEATVVYPFYTPDDITVTKLLVTDTLTNGKFVAGSVTVEIEGEDEVPEYTTNSYGDTNRLELDFSKKYNSKFAGKTLTITYQAVVGAGEGNVVNDIKTNLDEEGDVVTLGKTKVKVLKTGKQNVSLSGATFEIYEASDSEDSENGYIKYENVSVSGQEAPQTLYLKMLTEGVTAGEDGSCTFVGLDADKTYYVKETNAPSGYTVNPNYYAVGTTTKNEDASDDDTFIFNDFKDITVTDDNLSALPSTGGIGTTIFTIGGCAIMVTAAGLYFATRKKTEK